MARNSPRLVLVCFVVVLVAAACGGDEDSAQTEDDGDARPTVSEASGEDVVGLGDRFGWCADLAGGWAEFDARLDAYRDADQERLSAATAIESATDDLDLAEARQAQEAAIERLNTAWSAYSNAVDDAVEDVLNAYRLTTGQEHTDDETLSVASKRAWGAFIEQAPEAGAAAAETGNGEAAEAHLVEPSIREAVLDGDAYEAFRESFRRSCA